MRWVRNVIRILRQRDTEPTELASALLLFIWGFIVLLPPASFGVSGAFAVMRLLATEEEWGIAAVVVGTLGLYGVGANGWHYRRAGTFLQAMFWAFLATTAFLGNPWAPAWAFYLLLAVAAGWAYARVTWHSWMTGENR